MLPMEIVDHAYQRNNFVQRHLGYTNDSDSVRYFLKLNIHLDISIDKVEILSKENTHGSKIEELTYHYLYF